MLRALLVAIALLLATCGFPRDRTRNLSVNEERPRAFDGSSTAGHSAPLYRSGARLKIRWASSDTGARMPFAFVDRKLGRECRLENGACLPVAEAVWTDKVAYFDDNNTRGALLVEDALCDAPNAPDARLFHAARHFDDATFNIYVADAPRRVAGMYKPIPSGCVPEYSKTSQILCVRPLSHLELVDLVIVRDTILGTGALRSGMTIAVANDGALLPYYPHYIDARNGITCDIDVARCLPRFADKLEGVPVVGADVAVHSYELLGKRHATNADKTVWATIEPATANGGRTQLRKVVDVLTENTIVHLREELIGTGRIVLRVRVTPDGRRVPISLYDTTLASDCTATTTDDGKLRCAALLPSSCTFGDGALTPSSSFCDDDERESCCRGGVYWFAGTPARGPVLHGYSTDPNPRAATPGRAVRFASTPHLGSQPTIWVPEKKVLVYDQLEEVGPDIFAELQLTEDP